jgi:hypothetical protein
MARSIIAIDVNDAAFAQFQKTFNQYQSALKSQPAFWSAINQHVSATRKNFDQMVIQFAAANINAKLIAKAQEHADRLTKTTAEKWKDIGRSTKTVADNVWRTTTSLMRWGGLGGLVTGLLGAGGIFGLDRMAESVTGQRKSAGGLGIGYGQQSAFEINFQRFLDDPMATLGKVSAGLHDFTSDEYLGLRGAGLSQGLLQRGNAADVSAALIAEIPRLFSGVPTGLIGSKLQALRLDKLLSVGDVNRALANPGELGGRINQYGVDARRFDLAPDMQRRWNDFATQMQEAGKGIETIFVKGLSGLAEPLGRLSKSVESTIETFLGSDKLKQWINDLADGIKSLSEYIGTEDFQNNVRDFVKGIGDLADTLRDPFGALQRNAQEEAHNLIPEFFPSPAAGRFPATVEGGPSRMAMKRAAAAAAGTGTASSAQTFDERFDHFRSRFSPFETHNKSMLERHFTRIQIDNNTGGSAIVSTSALAPGTAP